MNVSEKRRSSPHTVYRIKFNERINIPRTRTNSVIVEKIDRSALWLAGFTEEAKPDVFAGLNSIPPPGNFIDLTLDPMLEDTDSVK